MSSDACTDCAASAERHHHGFRGGCMGCCARAAARSPQAYAARTQGKQTREYRALLEQFGLTHAQVREAYAKDAASRRLAA